MLEQGLSYRWCRWSAVNPLDISLSRPMAPFAKGLHDPRPFRQAGPPLADEGAKTLGLEKDLDLENGNADVIV